MNDNLLFDDWIKSLDTSENIIEHLKGQKAFHLKFLEYYYLTYIEGLRTKTNDKNRDSKP